VGWVVAFSFAFSCVVFASFFPEVQSNGFLEEKLLWIQEEGSVFGFRLDGISLPLVLLITFVGALASVYSISHVEEQRLSLYFTYFILFVTGIANVILSVDLIMFYLFWEFMLIPSFFLISQWGTGQSARIALKYFVITHLGALFLLIGIIIAGTSAGTTEIAQISLLVQDGAIGQETMTLSALLMGIGFAVKMAAFPVHIWLPDAHAEAPTPISVLLSGLMVKTGAYGFLRMSLMVPSGTLDLISSPALVIALVTMVYGGLMAMAQTDIKRLLAYSTISQMGYIFFGFSERSSLGFCGAFFHMLVHGISKSTLFMAAGALVLRTGTRNMKEMAGLGRKMYLTALAFVVSAFSLSAIPPLGGFLSEWMIFSGGFLSGQYLLSTVAVLQSILTIVYYLVPISRIFLSKPAGAKEIKEAPLFMILPMVALTALNLVLPLLLEPVLTLLHTAIPDGSVG
jgi:NADH-quinone oxidoreductase subunit M